MDLRIVFVKRSALAHKFEEERLKLAERAAFNGRGNLETSCAVFDCRCPRSKSGGERRGKGERNWRECVGVSDKGSAV